MSENLHLPLGDLVRLPAGTVVYYETEDAVKLSRQIGARAHGCDAKVSTKVYLGVDPASLEFVKLIRCTVVKQGDPRKLPGRSGGNDSPVDTTA